MPVKTTMKCPSRPTQVAKRTQTEKGKCWQGRGAINLLTPLQAAVGNGTAMWRSAVSYKVKIHLPIDPEVSL